MVGTGGLREECGVDGTELESEFEGDCVEEGVEWLGDEGGEVVVEGGVGEGVVGGIVGGLLKGVEEVLLETPGIDVVSSTEYLLVVGIVWFMGGLV